MSYPPTPPRPSMSHPPVGALGVPQFPPRSPHNQPPQQQSHSPHPSVQRMPSPSKVPVNQNNPQQADQKAASENDLVELENDVFTAHWMSGFYEPHPSNQMSKTFLYQDYVTTCAALNRGDVLSNADFFAAIR